MHHLELDGDGSRGVAIDGSESLVHPRSIILYSMACSTRFYVISYSRNTVRAYIINRPSTHLLSPAPGKAAGRKLSLSALINCLVFPVPATLEVQGS